MVPKVTIPANCCQWERRLATEKNITTGTKHGKRKSLTSRSNSISVHVCTKYAQSINEHPSVQFVLSNRIDIKHSFKMNIIQTSSYHIHHPIIIIGQCHIPNVSWCRHWHHTAAWSWLMRCFLGWPGRGVTPTKCSSAGMLRESLIPPDWNLECRFGKNACPGKMPKITRRTV